MSLQRVSWPGGEREHCLAVGGGRDRRHLNSAAVRQWRCSSGCAVPRRFRLACPGPRAQSARRQSADAVGGVLGASPGGRRRQAVLPVLPGNQAALIADDAPISCRRAQGVVDYSGKLVSATDLLTGMVSRLRHGQQHPAGKGRRHVCTEQPENLVSIDRPASRGKAQNSNACQQKGHDQVEWPCARLLRLKSPRSRVCVVRWRSLPTRR